MKKIVCLIAIGAILFGNVQAQPCKGHKGATGKSAQVAPAKKAAKPAIAQAIKPVAKK